MTNTKKIENSANSALDILLFDRDALVGQIAAIEAKEKPSDVERYALEGMRSKLVEINSGIAPQIEASIVARLFDVASEINSLVGENCEYLISLKDDGSDPEVTLLRGKGRKARKASGETQKKRVFAWNVNGLGIKEGATDIVKNLANCLVLATGEYKKYDVKGCCARKGWKVAPDIGPVALLLQGKIVKDESGKASRIPHALKLSSGKEIVLTDDSPKLYAHRRALLSLSKDRDSEAVKDAIAQLRDLFDDELKEDGVKKGSKKVEVNSLIEWIRDQSKIADQADADVIG